MKKILSIIASSLLILSLAPDANAQLLKKLGEAAKSAAENAVNTAASKIPGNKQNSKSTPAATNNGNSNDNVTTRGTYPEDTDPFIEFVDNLGSTIELSNLNSYFPEMEEIQPKKFSSISEAIKAYPKLPTAAQIVSADPAAAKAYLEFKGTATRLFGNSTISSIDAIKREANTISKKNNVSAAQMAQAQDTAMEMFKLMEKYGIDPDKMSEAELMDFMKKRAASGELKLPAGVTVADIIADEEETADDKLDAKIQEIVEKVNNLVVTNPSALGASTLNPAIKSVFDEIMASWKGSDSYKKVYDIEKDIDKRALEYFEKDSRYKNGELVDYPSFWVDGRKKENAIINDLNTANANKWVKVLQAELDKYLPLLDEIAALDKEIDALYPDKQSSSNLMYKNNLGQAFSGASYLIDAVLEKAYAMPLIGTVAEADKMSMF
ncbi:MAG: hypothetical protein MJZ16_02730 [Bacteroidales bacterium]|nr:hypothetical protein [Bacteroidales bacterium]